MNFERLAPHYRWLERIFAGGLMQRCRTKIILASLYACFKISTSLSARRLTPPDPFLKSAGFALMERRLANFGFAHADLWRRKI
jgi:hypothetical protein